MVYFAYAIPFIAGLIMILLFRSKLIWWELLIPIAATTVFVITAKIICVHALTTDDEYLGGYVKEVRYYEDWNERIHRTCCYKCGKSTCCHDCSYTQYHPERWTAETSLGTFDISEARYNALLRQFNAQPVFYDMHRHYHTDDGDMYYGQWKGEDKTLEPVTATETYENRPRAATNVYHFDKPDTAEIKEYGLFEYPKIYNVFHQELILGVDNDEAEKKLQILNARLGGPKQVRVFILVFKNQPRQAGIMQENYWEGGNKNEFVVCIGIDDQHRITWAHDFSWTEREDAKVEVRTFIEGKSYLPLVDIVDYLSKEMTDKWERKDFADFDYLNIEPTLKQVVWIYILTILVNVGICWWAVANEHEEEYSRKKKKYKPFK
jgi:hypothetical protein